MAVHLYAICSDATELPGCTGVHQQPLRFVSAAGLSALVSDAPAAPGEDAERELWEHEYAVEGLMANGDVLPARFGTQLRSDAALREVLVRRRGEFSAVLRRVAGACELAVRAAWRDRVPDAPAGGGAGYLAARAQAEHRAEALARQLDERLAPLSRERLLSVQGHPTMPVVGSYLVDREQMSSFVATVDRLDEQTPGTSLVCTGPWPPYSFSQPEQAR
jgi:hypothetical protein